MAYLPRPPAPSMRLSAYRPGMFAGHNVTYPDYEMVAAFDGRCEYCGEPFAKRDPIWVVCERFPPASDTPFFARDAYHQDCGVIVRARRAGHV